MKFTELQKELQEELSLLDKKIVSASALYTNVPDKTIRSAELLDAQIKAMRTYRDILFMRYSDSIMDREQNVENPGDKHVVSGITLEEGMNPPVGFPRFIFPFSIGSYNIPSHFHWPIITRAGQKILYMQGDFEKAEQNPDEYLIQVSDGLSTWMINGEGLSEKDGDGIEGTIEHDLFFDLRNYQYEVLEMMP